MTLEEIRKDIDKTDNEIKRLFTDRMRLSEEVVKVKAKNGGDIYKPEREAELIERLSKDVSDDIKDEYVSFIKHILVLSRKYQYGRITELSDTGMTEARSLAESILPGHDRIRIMLGSKEKKADPLKVLSVIAVYGEKVSSVSYDEKKGTLEIELTADILRRDTMILLFHLSKENDGFRIVESYTA